MPRHRAMSHHPRTTTAAPDASGRTLTPRGIDAPRRAAKPPAPVARATLHDDRTDTCRTLDVEGASSCAPAISLARRSDDGTAAHSPLPIRQSTGRSTLARSATAPGAHVDAGPSPVATAHHDLADTCRALGVEDASSGAPAVAARLLLKGV
ncbi:hypothetical protein ABT167_10870 [Streptomyces sp. NPDC001792]|uniref:hypothetical protein n=1 Tax=Streptomyces sp. NPDC001792 TaxID=3154524 RepID=UPI0033320F6B